MPLCQPHQGLLPSGSVQPALQPPLRSSQDLQLQDESQLPQNHLPLPDCSPTTGFTTQISTQAELQWYLQVGLQRIEPATLIIARQHQTVHPQQERQGPSLQPLLPSSSTSSSSSSSSSSSVVMMVSCPVCQAKVQESKINEHLDSCLS